MRCQHGVTFLVVAATQDEQAGSAESGTCGRQRHHEAMQSFLESLRVKLQQLGKRLSTNEKLLGLAHQNYSEAMQRLSACVKIALPAF